MTNIEMLKEEPQIALISEYLKSRGVDGFRIGGGRFGLTGCEITIENCTSAMFQTLNDACADALISRGGGGMAGSHSYRQINPSLFSDPIERARNMVETFESTGQLPLLNIYNISIGDDGNLIGPSGFIVWNADEKTKAMTSWVLNNYGGMMQQAEALENLNKNQ